MWTKTQSGRAAGAPAEPSSRQAVHDIGGLFRVSHNRWSGQGTAQWHRHIEIVYPVGAQSVYDIAGHRLCIAPGQVALFSAAIPHRIVEGSSQSEVFVINLPMELFFGWSLPASFRAAVFHGEALVYGVDGLVDAERFALWERDTHSLEPARVQIVLLEVQALIRRLTMLEPTQPRSDEASAVSRRNRSQKLMAIIDFVAANIQDPALDVARIAEAAGLNPKYVITLFRKGTGTTLAAYIRRARATVAHTLLLETAKSIPDVAFEAGFGSLSQFYEIMKREIGIAPGELRKLATAAPKGSQLRVPVPDRLQPPSVAVPSLEDRWL